ncbi:ankyrin repeat-containing domain protein [Coprinopsis sp. MPI-PUGE-AT-0042]|nr:ankyrin repeat-containing domain protein [Coprinopsis sp. MPI-PUGE-AT-0042]
MFEILNRFLSSTSQKPLDLPVTEYRRMYNETEDHCISLKTEAEFEDFVIQTVNSDPPPHEGTLAYLFYYATTPGRTVSIQTITTLFKHGAKVEQEGIYNAIHATTNERAIELLRTYLDAGWDIHKPILDTGDALWESVTLNNEVLVKWLLDHGANPAHNEHGHGVPGLAYAAMKASPEIVTMLVEKGKLPIKDSRALEMAAKEGRLDNIVRLLELGADVNSVTIRSEEVWYVSEQEMEEGVGSALHYAVQAGHADAAKLLLDQGANASLKDTKGFTALERAKRARKNNVIELIESHST